MSNEKQSLILKAVKGKGWNLYYRGTSNEKLEAIETVKKGPVDSLEKEILYIILPKVSNPTDMSVISAFLGKHQISPKMIISDGFPYYGKIIAEFSSGKDELFVHPGDEMGFIGIELLEDEVRLLSPRKTFMPYEVFLKSLDSLQDISNLN